MVLRRCCKRRPKLLGVYAEQQVVNGRSCTIAVACFGYHRYLFTSTGGRLRSIFLACRDGSEPYAAARAHQEDVQDVEPPLPHATGECYLHERGAERNALLARGVTFAAGEDQEQDALRSLLVSSVTLCLLYYTWYQAFGIGARHTYSSFHSGMYFQ